MDKGILIFVEGDTETTFYKALLSSLRPLCEGGQFDLKKIETRNLKGIGNYKKRILRVVAKEMLPSYPDVEFEVFICYDTDVFEFSRKPLVDWEEVKKELKSKGIKKVTFIEAKTSIEDWFLNDLEGLVS